MKHFTKNLSKIKFISSIKIKKKNDLNLLSFFAIVPIHYILKIEQWLRVELMIS